MNSNIVSPISMLTNVHNHIHLSDLLIFRITLRSNLAMIKAAINQLAYPPKMLMRNILNVISVSCAILFGNHIILVNTKYGNSSLLTMETAENLEIDFYLSSDYKRFEKHTIVNGRSFVNVSMLIIKMLKELWISVDNGNVLIIKNKK